MMIDFTQCQRTNKMYGGANGTKISVFYEGELYLLKFPPSPTINKEMSYTNSCISEYIGCHIFNEVGIKAQETLLGTYTNNGQEKVVVACKDFAPAHLKFQDFASMKNQIIDSENNGYGTDLSSVLTAMEEQFALDPSYLIEHFWDQFIVDAYIGNWDRHNGNWGFLYDETKDLITIAPVFDCGSSLYPQANEETMRDILTNPYEMDIRIKERPTSALSVDNKRIKYVDFLASTDNKDCLRSLKKITPIIRNLDVKHIVNNTPGLSELSRDFYVQMLSARQERILEHAIEVNPIIRAERESQISIQVHTVSGNTYYLSGSKDELSIVDGQITGRANTLTNRNDNTTIKDIIIESTSNMLYYHNDKVSGNTSNMSAIFVDGKEVWRAHFEITPHSPVSGKQSASLTHSQKERNTDDDFIK